MVLRVTWSSHGELPRDIEERSGIRWRLMIETGVWPLGIRPERLVLVQDLNQPVGSFPTHFQIN